jgi:hypothetical protein
MRLDCAMATTASAVIGTTAAAWNLLARPESAARKARLDRQITQMRVAWQRGCAEVHVP